MRRIMNKIKFKYFGERKNKHGVEKSYDKSTMSRRKLQRLKDNGWKEIIEKPKPKPKAKKEAKKKK